MPTLRRWLHRVIHEEHNPHPGDVLLGLAAAACFTGALALLLLPAELATGPSHAALYGIPEWVGMPGRQTWALLWALIGVAPLVAVLQPSVHAREIAYNVLLPAGLCWTVGLTWPLLTGGPANFAVPLAWAFITAAGFTIWALIPLDAPFYRPARNR